MPRPRLAEAQAAGLARWCCGASLLLLLAPSAFAQLPAGDWDITGSAFLTHRRLAERAATGATLLTEKGPMAQVLLQGQRPLPSGGALGLRGQYAAGDLQYDGQTQAGVPLATRTRHFEGGLDLMWRPQPAFAWGEAWLSAGLLAIRRVIRGRATVGGLDELSTALMLGVRWRSPGFAPAPAWTAHLEGEARVSAWHRLDVDYYGLLDASRLRGARKRQLVLRLLAAPDGSAWEWGVEWAGLWQPASRAVGVSRAGVPLPGTTVWQPELSQRDFSVRVTRRF